MSELPDNNRDEARRWLANVGDDLATLRAAHRDPDSPARMTCFLAHLIVEKSLKATLIDAGITFKKVHNLLELHDTCVQAGRLSGLDRRMLASCNPWAIDGRYADDLVEAERGLAARPQPSPRQPSTRSASTWRQQMAVSNRERVGRDGVSPANRTLIHAASWCCNDFLCSLGDICSRALWSVSSSCQTIHSTIAIRGRAQGVA